MFSGLNLRFIFYFLVFSYVPLLIFSSLGYYVNKNLIRRVHEDKLDDVAREKYDRLYDFIEEKKQALVKFYEIKAQYNLSGPLFSDAGDMEIVRKLAGINSLYYINRETLTVKPEVSSQLQKALVQSFQKDSNFFYLRSMDQFFVGHELDQNLTVLAGISTDKLQSHLVSRNKNTRFFLLSHQKGFIISADSLKSLPVAEKLPSQKAPLFKNGGHPEHLSKVYVLDGHWQFVALKPVQGIYQELNRFLFEIVLANLVIGILILSVAVFISRQITKPLHSLIEAAKKISSGNLSQPITVDSKNEVKTLAREFEMMRRRLLESYTNLESKIEERTNALREAQFQISHQEKMASLGLMAAGIAHEIGNPLTSISSMTQILKRKVKDEAQLEYITTILKNIDRISKIVRELVDFARPSSYETAWVNVNELIRNAVNIVKYDRRAKHIDIRLDLDSDIPQLYIVADQILQVFINILINAVDALTEADNLILVRSSRSDDYIKIEFEDTGSGIPEENLNKIFEPFFTTKKVGKGTGLGLSVSYGIIKNFNGLINVNSEIGKGSTFTVKLPIENTES